MIDWSAQLQAQKEEEDRQKQEGAPSAISQTTSEAVSDPYGNEKQIFTGKGFMDAVDLLSVGQYAVAGALRKINGTDTQSENVWQAAKRGVNTRASNIDTLKALHPEESAAHPEKPVGVGLAADMLLDPLWLIPPAKIAGVAGKGVAATAKGARVAAEAADLTKVAGKAKRLEEFFSQQNIAQKTARNIADKLVNKIPVGEGGDLNIVQKAILSSSTRLARPAEFVDALEHAQMVSARESGEGFRLAKRVRALSKDKQEEVRKAIEEGFISDDPVVMEIAGQATETFTEYGQRLNELGALADESLKKFEGRYLPKYVEQYEQPQGALEKLQNVFGGNKVNALDLGRTKQRIEKPTVFYRSTTDKFAPAVSKEFETMEDARKFAESLPEGTSLQKIADPSTVEYVEDVAYRIGKGISDEAQLTKMAEVFKFTDEKWAKSAGDLKKLEEAGEDVGAYLQMPTGERWGELSGKFVPSGIWYDLNKMSEKTSDIEKLSSKFYGAWKAGKTIYNPATHARNMMSNVVLNDMGGVSPARLDVYGKAFKEFLQEGDYYKEASEFGLGVNTFIKNEIQNLYDAYKVGEGSTITEKLFDGSKGFLNRMTGGAAEKVGDASIPFSKGARKIKDLTPSNVYEAEEEFFKLAHYIYKRDVEGLAPAEAFKSAQKWLFDYKNVPEIVDKIRKAPLGAPFVTFTYKIIPRVGETLIEAPTKITKYYRAARAIEELSPEGVPEEEKKVMPDWMQEGAYIRLPDQFNSPDGRTRYLNLSYMFPWAAADPRMMTMNNPLYNSVAEVALNKNSFTGQPIWNETDSDAVRMKKVVNHIVEQAVPPLAPGGYNFKRLKDQVEALIVNDDTVRSDYWGRTYTLPDTLLETIGGVKTYEVDVEQQKGYRMREAQDKVDELKKREYSVRNNQGLTDKEKEKELEQIQQDLDRVLKEAEDAGL